MKANDRVYHFGFSGRLARPNSSSWPCFPAAFEGQARNFRRIIGMLDAYNISESQSYSEVEFVMSFFKHFIPPEAMCSGG